MPYILYNNKNYFKSDHNGIEIVDNREEASKWKTLEKANRVLKNEAMSKDYKKYHFRVLFIPDEEEKVNSATEIVESEKSEYNIYDKVKDIMQFTKEVEDRKDYLLNEISTTDKEIVDIEHAAEFYELDKEQGYKLYKMLHDVRVKRRIFKNELLKIQSLLGTPINNAGMNNLAKSLDKVNNQTYKPRIHAELFEK